MSDAARTVRQAGNADSKVKTDATYSVQQSDSSITTVSSTYDASGDRATATSTNAAGGTHTEYYTYSAGIRGLEQQSPDATLQE